MTIRLIASDLDGTLFASTDHLVAPRTVSAVNHLHDLGIVTVAITGRSRFGGLDRAARTGARFDWFIGSNGGHRVNAASRELVEQLRFDEDELQQSVASIRAAYPGVGFGWELGDGFMYDEAFTELVPSFVDGGLRVSTSAKYQPGTVGKFFAVAPSVGVMDLAAGLQDLVPAGANATTSGVEFLEVTPAGGDKGSALARLCAELGIAADEVVAFGDNHNDLTMLEWSGRGVAMGNAVAAAKDIANEVTAHNDDFGVALVLEDLASELAG